MQRVIMHMDFNSYFASCEQQDNPEWRGKPLGVCEHLGGIIIAPSIEAKRWGIKTAMPVWEARKLYPKIILTPTHPDRYRFYTARFLKVLGDYTDQIEKYSIDEAFVDLTKATNITEWVAGTWQDADPFIEAAVIAKEIKRRMKLEVGDWLQASAGIGWNKLVAKIASDMQKPNGLVVVPPYQREWLYERLVLTDIPGIGKRQERRLNELGIKTLRDLRDYPEMQLVTHFGILGKHLHQMGQLEGSWKEGFDEDSIKSIGHVYTIPMQYRTPEVLEPVLYKLSEMVGARMRVNRVMGNVISVYMRDTADISHGKSKQLGYSVIDGRDIFLEARNILRESPDPIEGGVRQVGVTVAGLSELHHQLSLFNTDERQRRVVVALDMINEKHGDFTAARVPAFLARDIIRDSIGFGRMKEFKSWGRFMGAR
jgi:DNA polymerase-4